MAAPSTTVTWMAIPARDRMINDMASTTTSDWPPSAWVADRRRRRPVVVRRGSDIAQQLPAAGDWAVESRAAEVWTATVWVPALPAAVLPDVPVAPRSTSWMLTRELVVS